MDIYLRIVKILKRTIKVKIVIIIIITLPVTGKSVKEIKIKTAKIKIIIKT